MLHARLREAVDVAEHTETLSRQAKRSFLWAAYRSVQAEASVCTRTAAMWRVVEDARATAGRHVREPVVSGYMGAPLELAEPSLWG